MVTHLAFAQDPSPFFPEQPDRMRPNPPVTDHQTHVARDPAGVANTDLEGTPVRLKPGVCQVRGHAAEELPRPILN